MYDPKLKEKLADWLRNQVGSRTSALFDFTCPDAAKLATILLWLKTRQQCFVIADPYWANILEKLNVNIISNTIWNNAGSEHQIFVDLKALATARKSFLISAITYTEITYVRNYQIHTDGCYDLFPFVGISLSVVNELCEDLAQEFDISLPKEFLTDLSEKITDADSEVVIDLTYKEVEDTHYAELPCKLIEQEQDPSKSEEFWKFTSRQKHIICQLWARNNSTKHKDRLILFGPIL